MLRFLPTCLVPLLACQFREPMTLFRGHLPPHPVRRIFFRPRLSRSRGDWPLIFVKARARAQPLGHQGGRVMEDFGFFPCK